MSSASGGGGDVFLQPAASSTNNNRSLNAVNTETADARKDRKDSISTAATYANNIPSMLSHSSKGLSGSRQSVFTVPGNVKYQTLDMRLYPNRQRGMLPLTAADGSNAGGDGSEQISRSYDTRSAAVRVLSGNDKRTSERYHYDQELCCVFVGDYGIGKSTLIDTFVNGAKPAAYYHHRFKLQPPRNARIDMFQYKIVADDDQRYLLTLTEAPADTQLIDMERVRSLHYNKADVFLLCFSVVWRPSFNLLVDKLLPEVQAYAPKKPKILVGLRADLRDSKEVMRQLSAINSTFPGGAGKSNNRKNSGSRTASVSSSSSPSSYAVVTNAEALAVVRNFGLNGYYECSSVTEVGLRDVFRRVIYVHNNTEILQTTKISSSMADKKGDGEKRHRTCAIS